jgi:hypothetical protein
MECGDKESTNMLAQLLSFVLASGLAGAAQGGDLQPLAIVDELPASAGDSLALQSACLDGNELVIEVAHSGGCAQHTYDLLWDGRIIETFPVSIDLLLRHDSHGDTCEAYLMRTLRFDVSELGAVGEARIRVAGPDGQSVAVGTCE